MEGYESGSSNVDHHELHATILVHDKILQEAIANGRDDHAEQYVEETSSDDVPNELEKTEAGDEDKSLDRTFGFAARNLHHKSDDNVP